MPQTYADSIIPDTWVVGGLGEYYIAFAVTVNHYDCPRSMVKKALAVILETHGLWDKNDTTNALKG
jgi:hypothetical protein